MTAAVNGHRPALTDREDVRVCVIAPETPPAAPETVVERDKSTYTRVIQDDGPEVKPAHGRLSQRVTDMVERAGVHADDVAAAVLRSRTLNEELRTHADVWIHILPTKDAHAGRLLWLCDTAGGLFRACVTSAALLIGQAVATRLRAQVGLALFLLALAAWTAGRYL